MHTICMFSFVFFFEKILLNGILWLWKLLAMMLNIIYLKLSCGHNPKNNVTQIGKKNKYVIIK